MSYNQELDNFIKESRSQGMQDQEIISQLVGAGWRESDIKHILGHGSGPQIPTPPSNYDEHSHHHNNSLTQNQPNTQPIAVVQMLSTHGMEYSIMFVSLLASAVSLGAVLHSLVGTFFLDNDNLDVVYNSGFQSFFATALVFFLPVFVYLFIRLKKMEQKDPQIKADPSRRKWMQFTQLITFLVGAGYIISFLYTIFNGETESIAKHIINALISVMIAGSIFIYYWRDEHKIGAK